MLLSNLAGLFLLIGVGYGAGRSGLVPASAVGGLTSLLMQVALPATVFTSMLRPFEVGFLTDVLLVVCISGGLFLLYAGLGRPLSRLFRVGEGRRGSWMLCVTFCNNCFMGFPVVYALFGEDGLALATVLNISFNLLLYSMGVLQVSWDRGRAGAAEQQPWGKMLCTGVNLALLLGFIFYLGQFSLPQVLDAPLQQLSGITAPLSMMITGMSLADTPVSRLFQDRDVLSCVGTRLVLYPLATWLLLTLVPPPDPLVRSVILVVMAMPSSAVAPAMAQRYGSCVALAARAVCLSSMLCVVTIPLFVLLL